MKAYTMKWMAWFQKNKIGVKSNQKAAFSRISE